MTSKAPKIPNTGVEVREVPAPAPAKDFARQVGRASSALLSLGWALESGHFVEDEEWCALGLASAVQVVGEYLENLADEMGKPYHVYQPASSQE
ncbi:hypothetical protein [Halomonas sp. H5]|uniref:hypothetical protein n=1 Tax=Halomonas sp. H5 TaxID=3423910 RepID=UPI003D36EA6E